MLRGRSVIFFSMVLGVAAAAAGPTGRPEQRKPYDVGLEEKVGARLVQVDVTVSGPPGVVDRLTRDDFQVKLAGRPLERFTVDRFCAAPSAGTEPAAPAGVGNLSSRATYLLYFDQTQLTLPGRQRALDVARGVIPKLVRRGARAMIVSNARNLSTIEPLTGDPDRLLAALDRLEDDRTQWDLYPSQETTRVAEVIHRLNRQVGVGGIAAGLGLARVYRDQELWRAERSLRRLAIVLGSLAIEDPPKAVIFFADTLRSNAGDHYMNLFGRQKERYVMEHFDATGALDRLVNDAVANGIRFYAVEAEGLVNDTISTPSVAGITRSSTANVPYRERERAAQDTLSDIAMETGGRSFLNGAGPKRIAGQILSDFSCMYLVSFAPAGMHTDRPIRVAVKVTRPGVRSQSRGRVVIQSDASRLTSRLLAAFATPEAARSDLHVDAEVIPLAYTDGNFQGLVQVSSPGVPIAGASWDLGGSLVSRGKVREDMSGRIAVSGPSVPVVLERTMTFSPGPFEIVAVAREGKTGDVGADRAEGRWPNPRRKEAGIGPVAVVQPVAAAFLRENASRTHGSLAIPADQPIRTDRPTALLELVCGDGGDALRVDRRLVGDTEVEFSPQELPAKERGCAQVRDLVPPDTLGEGMFRYVVRLLRGGEEVAARERRFAAFTPGAEGSKPKGAGGPAGTP